MPKELSGFLRLLGFVGWFAIIVLSVLPGSTRPHSGAGGISEHFIAYAMVAFCLSWNRILWRERVVLVVGLAITAGVLEMVQLYIPGRTAEFKGLWSAAGGFTGLILTMFTSSRQRA